MFCVVLLVGTVSAFEFDNIKQYDPETKTATIKNAFGLGDTIAEIKLDTPQINYVSRGYGKVAQFTVSSFKDYQNAAKELELFDKNQGLKKFERDYDYKYLTYENIEVEDYTTECNLVYNALNKSNENICSEVLTGAHIETREKWIKLNQMDFTKDDVLTIGIFTTVEKGDEIEWIPNLFGERIEEWAVWTEDLNVGLTHYWTLNETTGEAADIRGELFGIGYNFTLFNTWQFNTSGLIAGGVSSDGSAGNYMNTSAGTDGYPTGTGDHALSFWVKSEGASTGTVFDYLNGADLERIFIRSNGRVGMKWGGSGLVETGTGVANPNGTTWNNIVLNRKNGFAELWVDGVLHLNATSTTSITPGRIRVGAYETPSDYYRGAYDEFAIWNRSLTASEISDLYNGGTGITYSPFGVDVTLNSPVESFASSSQTITFNATAEVQGGATIVNMSLFHNGTGTFIRNETVALTGTINTTTFSKNFVDGTYLWGVESCNTDGNCGVSTNRTFSIDSTAPLITISSPLALENYGKVNGSLSLNWSVTDATLDSLWFNYNGTNVTVFGATNSTTFFVESDLNKNLTFYANDSTGTENFTVHTWDYKVFENSLDFNLTTNSGSIESYVLNVTLAIGQGINYVNLTHDGINISSAIFSFGNERLLAVNNYVIPSSPTQNNASFFFNIRLDDGTDINTDPNNQTINPVSIDNCSTFTNELLNISLFKERDQTPLNGTIELNLLLLNSFDFGLVSNLSLQATNVQNLVVCSESNLTGSDLKYSLEIKYSATEHSSELYHIQRADIPATVFPLALYDLNENFTTSFKVIYQNNNFEFVEDAIIQLQRKYISEGIYKVVEAPLTSSTGTAVLHIDLDTNKYKAAVVKNGVVLDTFENLVFICDSILTGDCVQELLGKIDPEGDVGIETLLDFAHSDPTVINDTVTLSFVVPSGTPSLVNLQLTQHDLFGNKTLCDQNITSSAGSIQCTFNQTIGDSYLEYQIQKNGELIFQASYIVPQDSTLNFLGNNFIIVLLLLLTLVGMAFTSPEWIIILGVITFLISGALWLLNGLSFVVGIGALIWLFIAAFILIFKMSRQEDR